MKNKKFYFILLLLLYQNSFAWNNDATDETTMIDDALKLKANISNGRQVFKICSNCHTRSSQGFLRNIDRRYIDGFFPILAGQHKNVLIKQLSDIRLGNRDNPQMYQYTLDNYIGSPQDIADVTGYIENLPKTVYNNIGPGNNLILGKKLYQENCTDCHGNNGEGNNNNFTPLIQGQHYSYMLRQFRLIKDGRRRNANEIMKTRIDKLEHQETQAVIDYVSRLKPAK